MSLVPLRTLFEQSTAVVQEATNMALPSTSTSTSTSTSPLTVVFMGRTGEGKSSLGNNLLGVDGAFPVGDGIDSETSTCKMVATADGSHRFIDVPGHADTQLTQEEHLDVFTGLAHLAFGGVDVWILVVSGRWSSDTQDIFRSLFNLLGEGGLRRTLLVQTRVDGDPVVYAEKMRKSKVGQEWLPRFGGLACVNNQDFSDADRQRLFAEIRQIHDRFPEPWLNDVLEESRDWQTQAGHRVRELPEEYQAAPLQKLEAWTCGRATRQQVDNQIEEAVGLHEEALRKEQARQAAEQAAAAAKLRQQQAEAAAWEAETKKQEAEERSRMEAARAKRADEMREKETKRAVEAQRAAEAEKLAKVTAQARAKRADEEREKETKRAVEAQRAAEAEKLAKVTAQARAKRADEEREKETKRAVEAQCAAEAEKLAKNAAKAEAEAAQKEVERQREAANAAAAAAARAAQQANAAAAAAQQQIAAANAAAATAVTRANAAAAAERREDEPGRAVVGGIIGGTLGLVGGPVGAAFGATVGATAAALFG